MNPLTRDEYLWLEDSDNPGTQRWLAKQAILLSAALDHPLRHRLRSFVQDLVYRPAYDPPLEIADHLFFSHRESSDDHESIYVCDGIDASPVPLITPESANGDRFTSVSLGRVAPDAGRVAVCLRPDGRDEVDINVINVADRKVLASDLPKFMNHRTTLRADLKGFYYVATDSRGCIVWYHSFDAGPGEHDESIVELPCKNPRLINIHSLTDSGHLLIIRIAASEGARAADYYWLPSVRSQAICLFRDFKHKAGFLSNREELFLFTDWNAPQGRILSSRIEDLAAGSDWKQIVAEDTNAAIKDVSLVGDHLFVTYVRGPAMQLRIYDRNGYVAFAPSTEPGTISKICGSPFGTKGFYEFSSIGVPPTIFEIHAPSGTQKIWSNTSIPKELVCEVESQRAEYRSKDGTLVTMLLTRRRDVEPNANTPTMLTAYGGFGVAETPRFTNRSALWIALGGLYAHAYIRGGGEFGEAWHRSGMREQKQNSFDDFISAAEWLIKNGFTQPEKLAIVGGSNSGLLVGAALTQRPELFAAVICFGPILDMFRYHLFPGAEAALDEYGCAENAADLEYLKEYSPYHCVRDGIRYPGVLFISGDADTRCHPMHARKMAARLQCATTSTRPILLDYHAKRGHATLLPLAERTETLTNQFCFLLKELDLNMSSDGRFRAGGFNSSPA